MNILFLYPVLAQPILPPQTQPCVGADGQAIEGNCGKYGVNDFVRIGENVVKFIWGISGSVALLFFVYGGVMMILSAGSSDKVGKARQIIINALIGLIVIFVSWLIVSYTFKVLRGDTNWNTSNWFGQGGDTTGNVQVNVQGVGCCVVVENSGLVVCTERTSATCPIGCDALGCVTFNSTGCDSVSRCH